MTGLLAILALGFFLGMRHATDPDHVIAVTTIVARHRSAKGAALIGAVWGVGHTLTILVVGSGIILFSWVIPNRLGLSMEFAVGVMLIVLGAANLRDLVSIFRRGPAPGTPAEGTAPGWLDRRFGGLGVYQLLRPLVVGIVHGLAGSAAVALLVLTAIANPKWAVLYLFIFGAGTIIGMMLVTAAIALPFTLSDRRSRFAGRLRLASGLVSVGFGCLLTYQIGIVHGLFTGHPRWTPF
jgi:high-affinity nickel permease